MTPRDPAATGTAAEGPSLFRRLVLCPLSLCCTFRIEGDEDGLWGECSLCRKRVGYVDRLSLRRFADRELEAAVRAHLDAHREGDAPARGGADGDAG